MTERQYLGHGDDYFASKENLRESIQALDRELADYDTRLLEVERNYISGKAREKILIIIVSFLFGCLSSGFWMYSNYSSKIVLLMERQENVIRTNTRQDSDIAELYKWYRNYPDIRGKPQ